MPVPLDVAKEAACRQERRGQVRAQRRLPALEREVPDGTSSCGHSPATAAQTSSVPASLEHRVGLVLDREIGLDDFAADLGRDRLRALASAAVVHEDLARLRRRTRVRTPSRSLPSHP